VTIDDGFAAVIAALAIYRAAKNGKVEKAG